MLFLKTIFKVFALLSFCTNLIGITLEEEPKKGGVSFEHLMEFSKEGYEHNLTKFGYFDLSMKNDTGMYDNYSYHHILNDEKLSCSGNLPLIDDLRWKKYKERNIGNIYHGKFSNENLRKKIDEDFSNQIPSTNTAKINSYLKDLVIKINSWDDYEKMVQLVLETYCGLKPTKYLIKSIDKFADNFELGKKFDFKNFKGELLSQNNLFKKYKIFLEETNNFIGETIVYTDLEDVLYIVQRKTKEFDSYKNLVLFSENISNAIGKKYKYKHEYKEEKKNNYFANDNLTYSENNFYSSDGLYFIDVKSFFTYDKPTDQLYSRYHANAFKSGFSEIVYTYRLIELKIKKEIDEEIKLNQIKQQKLFEEKKENEVKSLMKEI